ATVLNALAAQRALPERCAILEVRADLAARQRARLAVLPPPLRERVVWLERLPERPLRGVILANEVADALPFSRFTCRAHGVRQLGVAPGEGAAPLTFHEQYAAADGPLATACRE